MKINFDCVSPRTHRVLDNVAAVSNCAVKLILLDVVDRSDMQTFIVEGKAARVEVNEIRTCSDLPTLRQLDVPQVWSSVVRFPFQKDTADA